MRSHIDAKSNANNGSQAASLSSLCTEANPSVFHARLHTRLVRDALFYFLKRDGEFCKLD